MKVRSTSQTRKPVTARTDGVMFEASRPGVTDAKLDDQLRVWLQTRGGSRRSVIVEVKTEPLPASLSAARIVKMPIPSGRRALPDAKRSEGMHKLLGKRDSLARAKLRALQARLLKILPHVQPEPIEHAHALVASLSREELRKVAMMQEVGVVRPNRSIAARSRNRSQDAVA